MGANEVDAAEQLYEFGPFRVDAQKETLLRGGEIVPLTPKTFQILLVLVRHNKEVVTKDDLMKKVWPDTFVEEANLSRNIFMLRKALGESPQDHRYILTVPGRGYRLAENVHLVPGRELDIVAANRTKVQVQVRETKPWAWVAVAVVVLVAVAAGTFPLVFPRAPILTAKDTVVLADFTNSTGDSVFDGTLRQGMAVQLAQSPFLSLISDQRIEQTLRLMGRSADTRLTPEIAREICERTGSAVILEGSIAPLGSQYVLALRARNCRSGDTLDDEQVQAGKKEDVLHALTQMASKFRTRVGESISTVEQHDTPLAEATTSSLEALQAYSTGWRVLTSSGAMAALPFFRRAAEIDPNFAMAHASLGRIYADLDESDLSAENIGKAWRLRDRASDQERFFITAAYQTLVTGNLEQAQQTCEAWAQTFPREPRAHLMLAGMVHKTRGQYESAITEARKTIALDPDFAFGYYSLAVNQSYLGRLDDAERTLRRGIARGLEIDEFLMLDYDLAFLRGDQAGMDRAAAQAQGRSGGESWIFNKEAFALAYSGHLRQARSMSHRAVDQAQQVGQRERASLWEAGTAVREALFGNASEARKRATVALQLSKDREAEYGAAFALALSGDLSQAQALTDDLEKRFPDDTSVRSSYVPTLRALLALHRGDASIALETLQVAVPHELGVPRSSVDALFGALYPIYVRGEAYLAAHRAPEAAAEFQKILDHPGIVVSDPIGALARLQLGRAYAQAGDPTKAISAYQDFLTLWNTADPGIPILQQAQAEYAKLR